MPPPGLLTAGAFRFFLGGGTMQAENQEVSLGEESGFQNIQSKWRPTGSKQAVSKVQERQTAYAS